MEVEQFLARVAQAEKRFEEVRSLRTEVLDHVNPERQFLTSQAPGQKRPQLSDSTGPRAHEKFAAAIQASLFPPFQRWVELAPGEDYDPELTQVQEFRKELATVTKVMFSAIHNSNFDIQIEEALLDLAVGTGALLIDRNATNDGLVFQAVPIDQLLLEEGPMGTIGAQYRKHSVAGRNLLKWWPDAQMSEELQRRVQEKPDEPVQVIEGVIAEGSGFDMLVCFEKQIVYEARLRSNPWVVFRYRVMPGEVYGRGPLVTALADIKTLNKTKELILKNAAMAIAGAYTVADDGVVNINNIRIQPGSLIPVSSNGDTLRGPTIASLPRSGDFNVAQIIIEDLKAAINEALLVGALGGVDQARFQTAAEVVGRQKELAERIGSAFGRLHYELITPLVNRVLFLLQEMNLISPLEEFKIDGQTIRVEYKTPLAKAQKSEDFLANQQLFEMLARGLGPQMTPLAINIQRFTQAQAENIGADPSILNTEEEAQQLQAALQGAVNGQPA